MSNQITDGPADGPNKQVAAWVEPIYRKSEPAIAMLNKGDAFPIAKFYAQQRDEAKDKADYWRQRAEGLQAERDRLAQDKAHQQAVIKILTEALNECSKAASTWNYVNGEIRRIARDALARADAAGKATP